MAGKKQKYMTYSRKGKALFGTRARMSDATSRVAGVLAAPFAAVSRKRGARQFRKFADAHNRSLKHR